MLKNFPTSKSDLPPAGIPTARFDPHRAWTQTKLLCVGRCTSKRTWDAVAAEQHRCLGEGARGQKRLPERLVLGTGVLTRYNDGVVYARLLQQLNTFELNVLTVADSQLIFFDKIGLLENFFSF
uniref:Uncharacterized protein n=1 Tax=Sipha flava TaxID=143950 RepID=A0A2S2QUW3_9HEMI